MKNDTASSRKCSICPGPHEMKVNFLRCNYQPCKVGNKYCGSSIQIRTCEVNGKGFAVLDRKDGHFRRDNEEFITTKRHLFSNEETVDLRPCYFNKLPFLILLSAYNNTP